MACLSCERINAWLGRLDGDRQMVSEGNRRAQEIVIETRRRIADKKGWRWPPRGRYGRTAEMEKIVRIARPGPGRPSKTGPVTVQRVLWIAEWVDAHRRLDLAQHPAPTDKRMREALSLAEEAAQLFEPEYYLRRRMAFAFRVLAALLGCSRSAVQKAFKWDMERMGSHEDSESDARWLRPKIHLRRLKDALRAASVDEARRRLDPGPLPLEEPEGMEGPKYLPVTLETIVRASRTLFEE